MRADAYSPEKFWSKVIKTEACWLWPGEPSRFGYRLVCYQGRRNVPAHRLAWELANGPIPQGILVCHHCDNPQCVRPDHLFLGTPGDNMRDMVEKGRARGGSPPGEGSGMAVLDDAKVLAIRARHDGNRTGIRATGREFGVSHSAVISILDRRTWKHLP